MGQVNCKYHPLIPSRWECLDCEVDFCGDCVTRDSVRNSASCPLCKKPLQQAQAENFIVPFWERLPQFFLYPVSLGSFLFILTMTFALYGVVQIGLMKWAFIMLFGIPSIMGMFGLLIVTGIGIVLLRYLMAVLDETANGNFEGIDFSTDLFNEGILLPFKQLMVFVGMIWTLYALARNWHFTTVNILHYVYLFILPAQIMLLAVEKQVFRSISPLHIVGLISRIGVPYLIMIGLLFLMNVSVNYFISFMAGKSMFFTIIMAIMATLFMLVSMYNMMGYVIYQYHERLGFEVTVIHVDDELESHTKNKNKNRNKTKNDTHDPVIAEIEVYLKEGRLEEAATELKKRLDLAPMNVKLCELYYKLLNMQDDKTLLLESGDQYINVLCSLSRYMDAVKVCRELLEQDHAYKMTNPDVYLEMLRILRSQMAFKMCMSLSSNFHKRNPDHADIPEVYFLAGQVLFENLDQGKQAVSVLEYLLKQYPDHQLQSKITEYVAVIKQNGSEVLPSH